MTAFPFVSLGLAQDVDQIARVLSGRCLACHGEKKQEGGYSLSSFAKLRQAGDSNKLPIVAEKPEESELFRRLIASDATERMPLDSAPLTAQQIAAIKQWIVDGAKIPTEIENRSMSNLPNLGKPIQVPKHYSAPIPVSALALDPLSQTAFVSGYGEVTQWELESGRLLKRISVSGELIADIEMSLDGKQLAVSSGTPGVQGIVQVLQMSTTDKSTAEGPQVLWTETSGDVAADIAFSPDASQLAIAHSDGAMVILDLSKRTNQLKPSLRLVPHADAILAIAWSSAGDRLITGSRDRTAKIFNAHPVELIANYDKHQRAVGGVAYLGNHPVSFDETGKLRIWNGDDSDQSIAERDNLARFLERVLVIDKTLYLADGADVRLFEVDQTKVEEGKNEESKAKSKTVTRIKENDRLKSGGQGWIMCLAGSSSLIVAGTEQGEVIAWERNETNNLKSRFIAKP